MRVTFADAAVSDLYAIEEYVSRDSPAHARTVVDELLNRCESLAERPEAFPVVPRYRDRGVRRRLVRDNLIFYRVSKDRIEVLLSCTGRRTTSRYYPGSDPFPSAHTRIKPSCATEATCTPSRVKMAPRLNPREPDAEGLSWT